MANTRRTAAFILLRGLKTHEFPSDLLPNGPDRAFVQDLVYTTIRRLRPLRFALGRFLKKWPKGELEALLYVGAAQILYMPDVPDFAAVNETVDAAKISGKPNVVRVVNAVLRNLIRTRAEVEKALAEASPDVRESCPSPLWRRWSSRYGVERAEAMCAAFNRPAETFLAWKPPYGEHPRFEPLAHGHRVEDVPGYAEGAFLVQDPATAGAIDLMDVRPGERVLDACAAPGGKTVQLAWRGADVTACEVNPKRRRRLEENLKRMGLADRVHVIASLDAAEGAFDKILVDAPCSNTGVFRRRPDARWNWSEEKLAALVRLQAEILDAVAAKVAPGGALVYSTCSLEPEENEAQADAFAERHPDFRRTATRAVLPTETDGDGAFATCLTRTFEMSVDDLKDEIRAGTRVILQVRHGERPKMDPDDPTFGDALPLTDEGRRTARRLGEMLAEFRDDVQFAASPLTRTRMTAACIAEGMGRSDAAIPTDDLLGNGSFYYDDPAEVLDVFKPENFFPACFEYFATGRQRGFKPLDAATDACEAWLAERLEKRLFVVATHDLYIAAFLYARGAVARFTRENWVRFLDAGAILFRPDGTRRYALVRTGLSTGICGVPQEKKD